MVFLIRFHYYLVPKFKHLVAKDERNVLYVGGGLITLSQYGDNRSMSSTGKIIMIHTHGYDGV